MDNNAGLMKQIINQMQKDIQNYSIIFQKQTDLEKMLAKALIQIDEFTCIDHVNKLKTHFLPKFEAFGAKIDNYLSILNEIKISCVEMDQALSLKAGKSQLLCMEEEMNKRFIPQTYVEELESY